MGWGWSVLAITVLGVSGAAASPLHVVRVPAGRIAYAPEDENGKQQRPRVVVSGLDWSQPRVIATAPTDVTAIAWSPDGHRILFTSTPHVYPGAARPQARIVSDSGRTLGRFAGSIFPDSWSPDGSQVIIDASASLAVDCHRGRIKRQLHLQVFDTSGRLRRDIALLTPAEIRAQTRDTAGEVASVAWSPDGREVAYTIENWGCEPRRPSGSSAATTTYVVNLAARRPRVVYRPAPASAGHSRYSGPPAWSPDGSRLAFATDCSSGIGCERIIIIDVATRRLLLVRPQPTIDRVVWSRSSSELFFGTGIDQPSEIVGVGAVNLQTGKSRWLIRGSRQDPVIDDGGLFKLSGDGRKLISVAAYNFRKPKILVLAVDGSRSWRVAWRYPAAADLSVP
jgi:dipeptidyl aminopeptidase/acylaminoacyl peptidase